MKSTFLSALVLPLAVQAQSSSTATSCTALSPSGSVRPSVASGYRLQVVATGLAAPRGLALDNAGHLLVVEQRTGVISAHTINDQDGCVTLSDARNVTGPVGLNHGIQLSTDGNTLYASNATTVMSWAYDAAAGTVSDSRILVNNMSPSGHTTRTLLLSSFAPGTLLVSHGSGPNLDIEAADINSGISTIKSFNLDARTDGPYDHRTDGTLIGWGLRNSAGVGEHPITGGIYSVENSADKLERDGELVSENNPGEEMNFHGYLNGTEYAGQGGNFGYPWCFAVWAADELPNSGNLSVGQQFAIQRYDELNNSNETDNYCAEQNPPRITFQAHQAPLDIKWRNNGTEGWVTFRGSWNRETPTGYKVSIIAFENGEPTESSSSTTAARDIVKNEDETVCPENCFRPVAMAIDAQGRVFFSSDATGEIYLVEGSGSGDSSNNTNSDSNTGSSPPPNAAQSSFGSASTTVILGSVMSALMWTFM